MAVCSPDRLAELSAGPLRKFQDVGEIVEEGAKQFLVCFGESSWWYPKWALVQANEPRLDRLRTPSPFRRSSLEYNANTTTDADSTPSFSSGPVRGEAHESEMLTPRGHGPASSRRASDSKQSDCKQREQNMADMGTEAPSPRRSCQNAAEASRSEEDMNGCSLTAFMDDELYVDAETSATPQLLQSRRPFSCRNGTESPGQSGPGMALTSLWKIEEC